MTVPLVTEPRLRPRLGAAPRARGGASSVRPEPRPRLEIVRAEREAEAIRRRRVRRLALAGTAAAALCLFVVVVAHVVLTQNQFRLDALRASSAARQADYDRLRLDVAQLESPARIVAEAQHRLGMVEPPKVVYLAPKVDEPAPASPPAAASAPARHSSVAGPDAGAEEPPSPGWSTVKPHLAQR